MATIDQLERKIIELEQKLDVALNKTGQLQRESEKALDTAMHVYKLDEYGYLWAYDAETQQYHQTKMRVLTPEIANEAIKAIHIADGAVTGDKIEDGAVTNSKIGDKEVKSRNIADGAVTTDKIGDNEVKTQNIGNEAVTAGKIPDNAITTDKIAPNAVTTPKLVDESITGDELEDDVVKKGKIATDAVQTRNIKDQNVTNEKIKDHDLSWDKLDHDLQTRITTHEYGPSLSVDFGNSDDVGITQKTLTQSRDNLQNQINAIVAGQTQISLQANPSPVFVGVESGISLIATTNTLATNIKIKKGATELASGSGLTLNGYDTITPSAAGSTIYTAEFTIAGLQRSTTKSVTAVYPIYYGAGQAYTDAQTQASVRTSPAGTYNVTVANDGDYVFFVVPATMAINSAKMSGFDFPLQAAQNVEIEGVAYKYYQSANTYDAGTLTIVIS